MANKNISEYAWGSGSIPQDAPEGVDFREYLRILFNFKWGILSVAFLAGLIGLYTAYKSVPIYSSTTILQIEKEQNNPAITPLPSVARMRNSMYRLLMVFRRLSLVRLD